MPKASIVIRTFNEEKHIGNLLRSLQTQSFKNFETIIVDSGSTDETLAIARQFPIAIEQIRSVDFTFGHSLNVGCQKSKGDFLVFVSAHTLPTDEHWLERLLQPFDNEKVAMVYGRQVGYAGSKFSELRDFRYYFGETDSLTRGYANNANAAIRKKLWAQHPFDEYLFGLEDIEWATWAERQGYLVQYAAAAGVYHLHDEAWYQVFNRYRREAIAAARIGLPHPPQAHLGFFWLFFNLVTDTLASFPHWSSRRLEEILRFRYYQWKGSRQGFYKDRDLDFNRDKFSIFYPEVNKAVVIHGKGQASCMERPLLELKPGDMLVAVSHVGVCRTDLEVFDGTLGYYKDGVAKYPIVPGHEFSGTIVKIGANNYHRERFKVGDRVVGECILSRNPSDRKEVGVINHDGAYARFVIVPGNALHVLPEDISLESAAVVEPLAVVLRALRRVHGRVPEGASVAVIGAGPIGNLCAQILAREEYTVSVFDRNPNRLGYVSFIARTSSELESLEQFDCIIEATGSAEVLERILKDSRADATLLLLGFPSGEIHYNFEDLVGREKVIVGSVGADEEDFDQAIELLPVLDTEPFTKTIVPLSEYKKAWDLHATGEHLKILLKP